MAEVSVIIPFKDRLDWVQQAIESVLRQSLQDFEIILVDDGSEHDNSASFKKLDSRITYIRQSNHGPAAARNIGIQKACGTYIAFLDSDDLFLPEKLETQIRLMKQNNISFSHTSYRHMDKDGQILDIIHSGLFTGTVYPNIYQSCPIATPTVMLRRELLQDFQFPENLRIAEDIILWAKLSSQVPLLGIDVPLTDVRLHGKNVAFDSSAQIRGIANIINDGVLKDPSFKGYTKRLILSNLHLEIARHHLYQNEFLFFRRHLLRAFYYAPINLRVYRLIMIALLPKTIRNQIKHYFSKRRYA